MFKSILKVISTVALFVSISNAEPIDLEGNKKGIDITLKSEKSLVVGNNTFFVTLAKDGEMIKDAKVRAKFFMPEMPGMPFMEYKDNAKLDGDKYKMNINFTMSGTWQYNVEWKTSDGKKYKIRGSVNL